MGRVSRKQRRAEGRKVWWRTLEMLAVFSRFGREIHQNRRRTAGPRDRDRLWTGWRARYVVVGETKSERRQRMQRLALTRRGFLGRNE